MINSFIWSFLEQGGTKIVQLLVQIVLARLISPEAFGILAILLVFTNIADCSKWYWNGISTKIGCNKKRLHNCILA